MCFSRMACTYFDGTSPDFRGSNARRVRGRRPGRALSGTVRRRCAFGTTNKRGSVLPTGKVRCICIYRGWVRVIYIDLTSNTVSGPGNTTSATGGRRNRGGLSDENARRERHFRRRTRELHALRTSGTHHTAVSTQQTVKRRWRVCIKPPKRVRSGHARVGTHKCILSVFGLFRGRVFPSAKMGKSTVSSQPLKPPTTLLL